MKSMSYVCNIILKLPLFLRMGRGTVLVHVDLIARGLSNFRYSSLRVDNTFMIIEEINQILFFLSWSVF